MFEHDIKLILIISIIFMAVHLKSTTKIYSILNKNTSGKFDVSKIETTGIKVFAIVKIQW